MQFVACLTVIHMGQHMQKHFILYSHDLALYTAVSPQTADVPPHISSTTLIKHTYHQGKHFAKAKPNLEIINILNDTCSSF